MTITNKPFELYMLNAVQRWKVHTYTAYMKYSLYVTSTTTNVATTHNFEVMSKKFSEYRSCVSLIRLLKN